MQVCGLVGAPSTRHPGAHVCWPMPRLHAPMHACHFPVLRLLRWCCNSSRCAGGFVLVKQSSIDELFTGLPVWIVDR